MDALLAQVIHVDRDLLFCHDILLVVIQEYLTAAIILKIFQRMGKVIGIGNGLGLRWPGRCMLGMGVGCGGISARLDSQWYLSLGHVL